jgi:S-DNA-T family DNA segregation ATPase FtsK/SpoIIIE
MDSRIILDESGAERLLSRGDMLFLAPGVSKPVRHHGPWLTDKEIEAVCKFWSDQAEPEYDPLAMRALEGSGGGFDAPGGEFGDDDGGIGSEEFDDRYDEILAYVGTLKEVSASHIQTRFRLGYPRAARLIEVFEQQGVVGPASGSKKRQVLINELK